MRQFIQIFIIVLLALSVVGCHGCKEPMEDPCEGKNEFSGNIRTSQLYNMSDLDTVYNMASDSFFWMREVHFEAEGEDLLSYHWKIGTDARTWTTKSFSLKFDPSFVGEVSLKLITTHMVNNDCFPEDDGKDTLEKTIYFFPWKENPMIGTYSGVCLSSPLDTFAFEMIAGDSYTYIQGFPKGCNYSSLPDGAARCGSYFFVSDIHRSGISCKLPGGIAYFMNDSLIWNYTYWDEIDGVEKLDKFVGVKK